MINLNTPVITLGSPYGIGYEIFITVIKKNIFKKETLYCIGSKTIIDFYRNLLNLKINYLSIKENELDKLNFNNKKNKFILIDIDSFDFKINNLDSLSVKIDGSIALKSVETAARLVQKGFFNSVVTLPVSKKNINLLMPSFIGHTEFFRDQWEEKSVFMTFISKNINVFLLTTHVPLREVPGKIKPELVKKGIITADRLRQKLGLKDRLCFLGLNPHAGENGILGKEEVSIKKTINSLIKEKKINIDGPVAADTAFSKKNLNIYGLFISCYHDQGLIPFKMLSFEDGVNLSFGMKYIRTSVDHGTAVDIIGKNKANIKSFINAYKIAKKLSI